MVDKAQSAYLIDPFALVYILVSVVVGPLMKR